MWAKKKSNSGFIDLFFKAKHFILSFTRRLLPGVTPVILKSIDHFLANERKKEKDGRLRLYKLINQ